MALLVLKLKGEELVSRFDRLLAIAEKFVDAFVANSNNQAEIKTGLKRIERKIDQMQQQVEILQQKVDSQNTLIADLTTELTSATTNITNEITQLRDALGSGNTEAIAAIADRLESHNASLRSAVDTLRQANADLTADDTPAAG